MSRKKKTTYNDMKRLMKEMQEKMQQERSRMSSVMSDALLTDEVTELLGDYSDTDLRRIMQLVAGDIRRYISQVNQEKMNKKKHLDAEKRQKLNVHSDKYTSSTETVSYV